MKASGIFCPSTRLLVNQSSQLSRVIHNSSVQFTTLLYVDTNPVSNFIVGFPTLLLLDNTCRGKIKSFPKVLPGPLNGYYGQNKVVP